MYRKSYEVIAYAYEADTHCLACTKARFGNAYAYELGGDNTPTDSEGNEIHPYFLDYLQDNDGLLCGSCLEWIEEPEHAR